MKKKFDNDNYVLMTELDKLVDNAKMNTNEFENLMLHINKSSSLQSLQTTSDIANIYKDLSKKVKDSYLEFYYPHPVIKSKNKDFVRPKEIYLKNIMNVANLYKDTFDLIGDH